MKTAQSIRAQLEAQSSPNKQKNSQQPKNSQKNNYHRLGLNWKDVVIFSFTLVIGLTYNIQVNAQDAVQFDDIQSGMMMSFNKSNGEYRSLKLQNTAFDVDVFGLLATVTVKQQFTNQNPDWVTEGVYAFPLADMSALYRLRMTIGERVIEGEIHEKKKAELIYEQAKQEGRTATMVKQYRPNIFTSDIANIAPFETITVELTYQQSLRYVDGYFELQLPMTIKPRYIPADYDARLPMHANVSDTMNRHIQVHLDAGFELDEINSLYHEVKIESDFQQQVITLEDTQLYDSHDFVLRWFPSLGQEPQTALFSEVLDGYEYSLLMVMPPENSQKLNQLRNITFIIDTSGSMHGQALSQAKDALLYALSNLDADTYFNVIDFDSNAKPLFSGSMPAIPENINKALRFIDGFSDDGGTNMAPALEIAMQKENILTDRLNQIVFLTDGSVGNEAMIFEQIAQDIGDARLFTIAIGPAPNHYFMSKAAMFGRGSYTHIGDLGQVDESMRLVFDKLAAPAMTDIAVDWGAKSVTQTPQAIPDLYLGEPLVITSKTALSEKLAGKLYAVSGLHDKQGWSEQLQAPVDGRTTGIARLWARNQVEDWIDELMLGGDQNTLKDQIIELALKHHLVTEFTALVAVDKTPNLTRMAQAKAAQTLPYPQTALGWRSQLLAGLFLMLVAVCGRRLTCQ